jgi:hypothetical protein
MAINDPPEWFDRPRGTRIVAQDLPRNWGMRTVRVRIEGDIDCAIDLSNEDLLQLLRSHLPHELKPDTATVEVVPNRSLKDTSDDA